jgi:protein-tyrosine phosphatase
MRPGAGGRAAPPSLPDFADRVLGVVERIPAGRVMSYGDVAAYLGEGGPRQVGRVMSLWGGAVPWWRVIHSDGTPPAEHEAAAREHYVEEATPLRSRDSPVRVDMRLARWPGHSGILDSMTAGQQREEAVPPIPPPRDARRPYRICVVCMGNICRSPMAESIVRAEAQRAGVGGLVEIDSAGIGDWHAGEPMDPRASAELARQGYHGGGHTARQIRRSWLADRDLILAMDEGNLRTLLRMAGRKDAEMGRIQLLRAFDPAAPDGAEVPDPYLGDEQAFAHVLDLIEAAAKGLATRLAETLAP